MDNMDWVLRKKRGSILLRPTPLDLSLAANYRTQKKTIDKTTDTHNELVSLPETMLVTMKTAAMERNGGENEP